MDSLHPKPASDLPRAADVGQPSRPFGNERQSAAQQSAADKSQQRYAQAVGDRIAGFLASRRDELSKISPDVVELIDAISDLAAGGKRMRASLCYWGFRGAGGSPESERIISAGAALELFQSAALIHDDIIDNSDTRRGAPSVHRRFSALHDRSGWSLNPDRFGRAAAILAGDMCLSFSEELFAFATMESVDDGTSAPAQREGRKTIHGQGPRRARAIFDRMRAEVMAGQYLDVLEESAGPVRSAEGAVDRARAIIQFKSAKYSTERPLVLGGALAGADDQLLEQFSRFALPLGEAFQLRDDVLGVYGDPDKTGKPAGDDLREGKRTVLTGYTLQLAPSEQAALLEDNLGNPELTTDQVVELRRIMVECGALAATENLIDGLSDQAFGALESLDVEPAVRTSLASIGRAAIRRIS
ncbi:polyprenyl synthetase family protein [Arthrobacter castelli]|uniref:polyprenyl synthetase family protein n=1 Tax=Arthrobacter castelli TaxID=271431 RepID=UPI003CCB812F